MLILLLIFHFIISLIVASLGMMELIRKEKNRYSGSKVDFTDLFFFSFGAIFFGTFWVVTIWVSLLSWWVNEGTPNWVKDIRKLFKIIKNFLGMIKNLFCRIKMRFQCQK